jgi:diguanylate cyclase (GGDEF)-like protein
MGLAIFEGADSGDGSSAAAAAAGGGLHGSITRSGQVAPLARAGAYVSLAGMLLGFVGVLLPHPAQFNVPALIASECFTIVFSLFFLAFAEKVPMWMVRSAPAMGIVQATAAVIFSGDPTSAYVLFYLWPCFYAFYFLSRLDGAISVALVIAGYGLSIAVIDSPPDLTSSSTANLTHHFVLLAGTLAIAGVMMHVLRTRVDRLWGSLLSAARTDLTTGLLNGTGGHEVLVTEIDRARMNAQRVAILNVDLVGLREINASYGHNTGDDLLREIGRLLDDSTRRIDTVSRSGGSEFTLVLPETDEHTGFLLAEQILARLRRTYRERSLPIRASIGVAAFPKHAADAEALERAASSSATAASTLGSDRAIVYSLELEQVSGDEPARAMGERRTHLSTVLSLAEVLDLRDERFASHSMAVARYCELIGRELGLPEARIQRLRMAGTLHDIGKVGLSDSILEKPGPLSPSEWDEVRRHPEMAARILGARELTDIRGWILARHEQLDGHGYPSGISGDEIPLESRILAVAESYDAITSERPYRPARNRAEAIVELGRYSGSQFDGAVVDALVRALDRAATAQLA